MSKKIIEEPEVEIEEGQFLDDDGDIISGEFLSIFDKFPSIKEDNNLRNTISGLFYNQIESINIFHYNGSKFFDFRISTLKGQCSTLIVHDIMLTKDHYNDFLEIITKLAIGLRFSNILITLDSVEKLNSHLINDGFEMFKENFKNKRTGNKINYYMKYLN